MFFSEFQKNPFSGKVIVRDAILWIFGDFRLPLTVWMIRAYNLIFIYNNVQKISDLVENFLSVLRIIKKNILFSYEAPQAAQSFNENNIS